MHIRTFAASDAEAVSQVVRLALLTTNARDYPAARIEALHDYFTPAKIRQLAGERYCLVAEENGLVVGTGAFEDDELKTVFVLPQYQGKGVGRQLLDALEHRARQLGLPSLRVPPSRTSYGFYEKMGYAKVGPKFYVKKL